MATRMSSAMTKSMSTPEKEMADANPVVIDVVSVIANAGSFDTPSSFDDGYDSSNSFTRSPGKSNIVPIFYLVLLEKFLRVFRAPLYV